MTRSIAAPSVARRRPVVDRATEEILTIPSSAHTLAGYRAWAQPGVVPDYLRTSFIDGEIIVEMSREEITTHALLKSELNFALEGFARESNAGMFFPDGTHISNVLGNVSNVPDAMFVRWRIWRVAA